MKRFWLHSRIEFKAQKEFVDTTCSSDLSIVEIIFFVSIERSETIEDFD